MKICFKQILGFVICNKILKQNRNPLLIGRLQNQNKLSRAPVPLTGDRIATVTLPPSEKNIYVWCIYLEGQSHAIDPLLAIFCPVRAIEKFLKWILIFCNFEDIFEKWYFFLHCRTQYIILFLCIVGMQCWQIFWVMV